MIWYWNRKEGCSRVPQALVAKSAIIVCLLVSLWRKYTARAFYIRYTQPQPCHFGWYTNMHGLEKTLKILSFTSVSGAISISKWWILSFCINFLWKIKSWKYTFGLIHSTKNKFFCLEFFNWFVVKFIFSLTSFNLTRSTIAFLENKA